MSADPSPVQPRPDSLKGISHRIDGLTSKLNLKEFQTPIWDRAKHEDTTRSRIAFGFLIGYFAVLVAGFFYAWFENARLLEFMRQNPDCKIEIVCIKDVLLMLSGVIGTPLGFVIGYYFKSGERNGNSG